MTNVIDSKLHEKLLSFALVIEKELGISYRSDQKLYDLYSKLSQISHSNITQESIISIIDRVVINKEIPTELLTPIANILTINETYFFRESNIYPLLKSYIDNITKIDSKREIKIWSAGCSSGEEPFSIAIFIKENYPQNIVNRVKIIGSDISEKSLNKAAKGTYSKWSFRDVKTEVINKYFHQNNGEFQILDSIKEMVIFKNFNLISNNYPDYGKGLFDLDIILCRNVLMYFSEESMVQISNKFFNSLLLNGILITSAVEMNDTIFNKFSRDINNGAIFYRKGNMELQLKKIAVKDIEQNLNKLHPTKTHNPKELYPIKLNNNRIEPTNKSVNLKSLNYIRDLANRGELDIAINELNLLIENGRVESNIYYLYALVLSEKKEAYKALEMCQKALYLDNNNLEALILAGFLHMECNQKEKAIKCFQSSLKIMEKASDKELNTLFEEGINGNRLKEIIESLYIDLDRDNNG